MSQEYSEKCDSKIWLLSCGLSGFLNLIWPSPLWIFIHFSQSFLYSIHTQNTYTHAHVVYYCWILTNNEEQTHTHIYIYIYTYIYKCDLIFLFFNSDAYEEKERSWREFACTKGTVGSLNSQRELNFSQNSRPYIVLKLPCNPHSHVNSNHAMPFLHWSWFTPMHYLISIGHDLHPHIFLCLGYHTHTFLLFRSSLCWFYLWPDISVNYICQIHCRSLQ